MNLADLTTEDLKAAAMRALESLEGKNLYTSGPWPIDVRPLAQPMTVIYYAADNNAYERTMVPDLQGDVLNVVLGDRREVEARTLWVPIQGDVAPAFAFSAGKSTTWSGLIFRAGDYPDKGCSFAETDLDEFVANFPQDGVPVMSEHEESLLGKAMDRHGARLTKIWRKGGELHGEIRSPSWLDEALDGMRKSVSVGIDFATKTLREISLTFAPRVADAAVFQKKAAIAFSHSTDFQPFAAEHPSEAAKIVTLATAHDAPAKPMEKNKILERAKQFLFGLPPEKRAEVATDDELSAAFAIEPVTPPAPSFTVDPNLRAEIDQLKADRDKQNATFAQQKDGDDAARFFLEQLRAGKAAPSQEAAVLAEFSNARFRDRHTASFSEGTAGAAETALAELYKAKPALFRVGAGVLDSGAQPKFSDDLGVFAPDFAPKEEK